MEIGLASDYPSEIEPTDEVREVNGVTQRKWLRRWELNARGEGAVGTGYILKEEWVDVEGEVEE